MLVQNFYNIHYHLILSVSGVMDYFTETEEESFRVVRDSIATTNYSPQSPPPYAPTDPLYSSDVLDGVYSEFIWCTVMKKFLPHSRWGGELIWNVILIRGNAYFSNKPITMAHQFIWNIIISSWLRWSTTSDRNTIPNCLT